MKQTQPLTMKRILLVVVVAALLTGFEAGLGIEEVLRHVPARQWVGSFFLVAVFGTLTGRYSFVLLDAFKTADEPRRPDRR